MDSAPTQGERGGEGGEGDVMLEHYSTTHNKRSTKQGGERDYNNYHSKKLLK
jgi:hypothetical protein